MKKVLRIDTNGYFLEDVILDSEETTPIDCIEVECPQGFYKPKWQNDKWIEGISNEELEGLKKDEIKQPTLEERIAALETLMMGVI